MVIGAAKTAAPRQDTAIPAMAYLRACRPKALCDLIMGSTGPGLPKVRREWQSYWGFQKESVWDQPVAAKWFTIARAAKIRATKIHHKCGYRATVFQSDKIAAVTREKRPLVKHETGNPRKFARK
jgi:hypothetical protein